MVVIHSLHHLLMHAGSDGDVSVSPIHVQLYIYECQYQSQGHIIGPNV